MILTYHDNYCIRLQSGNNSVLIDPSNTRLKGDLVIHTTRPTDDLQEEDPTAITFPGAYEHMNIRVRGLKLKNSSDAKTLHTAYHLFWEKEDMTVGVLSGATKTPSAEVLDHVSGVDVLLLGVGADRMPTKEAVKVMKQLEPALVVPISNTKKALTEFVDALDKQTTETDKYTFRRKDLGEGAMDVVVLTSS